MIYARPLILALLLAAVADPAHAQQSASGARDTTKTEASRKDPGRAVLYSLGGTVLLAPAFGAGLIVGPSFGHFYAGNSAQAWGGIALRGGMVLIPPLAGNLAGGEGEVDGLGAFANAAYIAITAITISAIYDIADADNSARQYNRAHGLETSGVQMQVAPTVEGPRGTQVGLALRIRL